MPVVPVCRLYEKKGRGIGTEASAQPTGTARRHRSGSPCSSGATRIEGVPGDPSLSASRGAVDAGRYFAPGLAMFRPVPVIRPVPTYEKATGGIGSDGRSSGSDQSGEEVLYRRDAWTELVSVPDPGSIRRAGTRPYPSRGVALIWRKDPAGRALAFPHGSGYRRRVPTSGPCRPM